MYFATMEFGEVRPKVFFRIHKKLIYCLSCLLSKNSKNVVILHDYDIILKKASRLDNFLLTKKLSLDHAEKRPPT